MGDLESQRHTDVVVVYALPDAQYLVTVAYESGMTAHEAITRSGLPERFPEIASKALVPGLFGRPIRPDQPVAPGDRIEICRPLKRDPRELRRLMTAQGRVVGQREPGQS
ncbi:MAG: RnfH family protein [Gammaproteobacteria bacterium]|jgi:putative ubiquitin-RnfH superfamily antitoxin RatB of RatAB toxin-antitoxin module